jgi:CHAD domain-containing protein
VEARLESVYFDTQDLRLARWGCSLRHRTGEGWMLVLGEGAAAGRSQRVELSFGGPARHPPPEAEQFVRAYARRSPLQPMARLSTWRRTVPIVGEDSAQTLATIVDDEVSILQGRRVAARFRELEVATSADRGERGSALLDPLLASLQAAGAGVSDGTPQHVRALGPIASVPEVPVRSLPESPTAGQVITAALATAVTALLRHDPGVRLGRDPDAVHQARVALRRIRSHLRTFASLLDPEWATALRTESGWLADQLGEVRDREVLLDRLRQAIAGLDPGDARATRGLTQRAEEELAAARSTLATAMIGDRYLDLLELLVHAGREPRTSPTASAPAVDVVPGLVRRPWRQLRRAVDAVPDPPEDAQLHRLRILTKRLRYAAEAATPLVGERAARFARRAAALQTVLGEHQDSVVARRWIREAATRGRPAFAAGLLYGLEQSRGVAARAAWRGAWQKLAKRRLRSWPE